MAGDVAGLHSMLLLEERAIQTSHNQQHIKTPSCAVTKLEATHLSTMQVVNKEQELSKKKNVLWAPGAQAYITRHGHLI